MRPSLFVAQLFAAMVFLWIIFMAVHNHRLTKYCYPPHMREDQILREKKP